MPKEKLLNALWPGVSSESATSRLYSNLSILRSVLAEQVPGLPADAVRGDKSAGMYRLDSSLVWSDVQEFLALIQGARKLPPAERRLAYEQARSLYRGDLLTDMPYKWVNAEDERGYTLWEEYREEYRQLTGRLAQLYSVDGEPERAVLLYRDLLRDEPTLEDVVRQLFRCYQQLGDRNSLIRDERLLREAIRQRYYDPEERNQDQALFEPEPETVEVYREVLADLQEKAASSAVARRASSRDSH
jgi:two-component SAPR family response regulator